MICFSGLELVGRLLCGEDALQGLTWCAVGEGDPAWDTAPPPADRNRRALTAEAARVPLATRDLEWRPNARSLRVRVTFPRGVGTGTLREVGLFGGDASARPGSGLLLSHRVHDPIDKGPDDRLDRELAIDLPEELAPGARDLVGLLLARRPGVRGVTHLAVGSSGAQAGGPRRALAAETGRVRLDRRRIAYDATTQRVLVAATVPAAATRGTVRELGLLGGDATDAPDTGQLVDRAVVDTVPAERAVALEPRFTIRLAAARTVTVPDVVGASLEEARAALAAVDLALGPTATAAGTGQAAGQVVAQEPAGGVAVGEASAVALVVAIGDVVTVPAVVGVPVGAARDALEALGLVTDEQPVEVDTAAIGTVVAATPPAGTPVGVGVTVVLSVASPPIVTVPDVRGRTRAAAELLAAREGLAVTDDDPAVVESAAPSGTVVDQDPAAGLRVPRDRPLRVRTAVPFSVDVPDLTSVADDDVADRLAAAAAPVLATLGLPADPPGLAVGTRRAVAVARPEDPLGVVVAQRPPPGTAVPLYSTVTVDVSSPLDRPVPSLVGRTEAAARAALAGAGFALGAISRRASDATPGTVVAQDPSAGAPWPSGGRVAVVLATARTVRVPDVVGLAQAAAREAVAGRGLTVGALQAVASTAAPGEVTGQRPDAGTVVAAGSAVDLFVAAGVPDVVGMSQAQATSAIEGVGLVVAVTESESSAAAGTVLAQDPAAGTAADPGTTVTIAVAIAVRAEVPDVVGRSITEADRAIADAGLKTVVAERREDDTVAEGTVLAQDPAGGTRVGAGAVVSVTIGVAPQRRAVPDLTGTPPDEAERRCRADGFRFAVTGEVVSRTVEPGRVAGQDPLAGTVAVLGTVVTVVLASAQRVAEVPDLRGLDQQTAVAVANRAGLGIGSVGTVSTTERAGLVLDQEPAPGNVVPLGTALGIVIGVAAVQMPQVVGMDEGRAVPVLEGLGLRVTVQSRFVRFGVDGRVVSQIPAAGTVVLVGRTVTITVIRSLGEFEPGREILVERPIPIPDPDPVIRPDPVIIRPPIFRPPIL